MRNIMKYVFNLFLIVVLLLPLFYFQPSQAEAGNGDFAGGDGSADDPYQVATAEQLDSVRDYLNAHFIQVADIDLRDFLNPGEDLFIDGPGWEPIGTESNPFSGKFDGDGYTIYSLFINRDANYIGLFGYTNSNSVIIGVKLQLYPGEVYDITGNNFVGSLVGHNGGLISQCSAEMRVKGKNYVGGLVGYNHNYTNPEFKCIIEKSFFLGDVYGKEQVGGLVGGNYGWAKIENCYVKKPYQPGYVEGDERFGGLVGENLDATISKSYAVCVVQHYDMPGSGTSGGIVGYNSDTTAAVGVFQSYYNSAFANDNGEGEPRTTEEMTYPYEPEDDVYEDWDFDAVWVKDKDNKNGGYPYLKWVGYDFDSGYGTAGNPFQVATAEQLDRVRDYLDAHFIQTARIDLDKSPYNEGEGWEPIGSESDPFTGSYDGDGDTIDDLYINRGNDNQIGLFGVIADNAMISNVHLENVDVTGNSRVGSLAGDNSDGTITSCSVFLGSVNGDGGVGGLVGRNDHIVKGSYTRVSVESVNSQAGGLVGVNWDNGAITEYSYATGSVKGINSVGGLVGSNRGIIDFCHADGPVEGAGHSVGGLVGSTSNNSSIMNSHATGNVEGEERVGGLVGRHLTLEDDDRYIGNCYATGDVTGTAEVGGLVGRNERKIINSYATGEVVGSSIVGGLTGENINRGFISDSWAEGDVFGDSKVGGLVGKNNYSTRIDVSIEKSFASGNVTGDGPEQEEIGGLVGYNQGTIEESWAEGDVSGYSQVGGLVGFSESSASDRLAIIKNSYATGGARGNSDIGGLVGLIVNATVGNTYATGLVNGKENVGGLVGQNDYVGRGGADGNIFSSYYDSDTTGQQDTGKGIPKTTKEMLSGIPSPEIYTEWPTTIWNFTKGEYPNFIISPTNADLSALIVTPGVLTPPFNAARVDYTVDVTHDVDSVSVTATLSRVNWNASITIDGNPTLSGRSRTIELNDPSMETEIEVVVTAADGDTTKIYTITVNRGVPTHTLSVNSTNPSSGVSISSNSGHGGTTSYTSTVEQGASVNLTAPQYLGSGDSRKSFSNWSGDESSNNRTINFTMDGNKTVTANYVDDPDLSSDTDLSVLEIDPGSLDPAFAPEITDYTTEVPHDTISIEVTATLSDENAAMTIDGSEATSGEAKTVTLDSPGTSTRVEIEVTAENGEITKKYSITVNRAEEPVDPPIWANLTTAEAQILAYDGGVLAASVEGFGIGIYDGNDWINLTTATALALATDGSVLVASVENFGIWVYDGEWSQLIHLTAELLAADNDMIVASFAEHGIWLYDGNTWSNLTSAPARALAFDSGRLVASVEGFGTWLYDGNIWDQLTPETAQHLTISGSNIAASFAGFGIWFYDGNDWDNLVPAPARALSLGSGMLAASVDGFGTWLYAGEWNNILNITADLLAIDSGKVAASFEGQGIWLYE